MYRPAQASKDVRILASRSAIGDWTFYVVNRGASPAYLLLKAPDPVARTFRIYEYSRASAATDADGFPIPVGAMAVAPETGVDLMVPGEAVMVSTSVAGDPVRSQRSQ